MVDGQYAAVVGGRLASGRASVVAREPEAARVVVEQTGFTQRSSGGVTHVAYGLELVNSSYDLDALDVGVTVRFLGAGGHSLASDSIRLTGVPASTTFYVGGRARVVRRARIARLLTTVSVRASREVRLFLPVAADVRLGSDRFGRLRVTGWLTNAYTKTLVGAATVYAVIFDGKGSVIGGGAEMIASATGGEVAPGQTGAFEITALSPTPPRRAVFAGVSIDP
jgi:hypothetical protein